MNQRTREAFIHFFLLLSMILGTCFLIFLLSGEYELSQCSITLDNNGKITIFHNGTNKCNQTMNPEDEVENTSKCWAFISRFDPNYCKIITRREGMGYTVFSYLLSLLIIMLAIPFFLTIYDIIRYWRYPEEVEFEMLEQ